MRHARLIIASSVVVTAIAVPLAVRQQPQGDPFSTEIRPVKDGLYVIPGYDGAVTGGNVAVRVTNEGVIIVDDRLPPSSRVRRLSRPSRNREKRRRTRKRRKQGQVQRRDLAPNPLC